ncbi:hypothetical protein ACVLV4_000270 [Rathayibacter agropyri]
MRISHLKYTRRDSAFFQNPKGFSATDDISRRHLAGHINDHCIERYTTVHAPSPFLIVDYLADALVHLRDELKHSKRAWRDDIDQALVRTITAANGLIRVSAYLWWPLRASTAPRSADVHTNAAVPVIERPTIRVFISRVPSYE